MFGSVFMRLLWKEYRAQRGLWLGIAIATAATQLALHWLLRGAAQASELGMLTLVGVLAFLMYVAGSSAMLFGSELEEGTLHLLRSWGMRFGPFLIGKLAFGVAGTAALAGTLVVSTCFLFGQWVSPLELISRAGEYLRDGGTTKELEQISLFRGILLMATSCVLISVLTRHVLLSFVATMFLVGIGVVLPASQFFWPLIAAVDVWLLRREFHVVRERMALVAPRWLFREKLASQAWSCRPDGEGTTARVLRRLLWQEFRHAAGATGWFLAGAGALVACGILAVNESPLEFIVLLGVPAAAVLPTLVFHSEQRQSHFRFHGERGAEPWLVWFGKHVVWFPTVTLPILLLGIGLYAYGCSRQDFYVAPPWIGVNACCLAFLLIYSCGQFCSLLISRTLTAALLSIPIDACLLLWLVTMVQLRVPLVLSVVPIPLIFAAASLTAASAWLEERSGWKTKARPLVIVTTGLLATFGTVAVYRALEISWGDVNLDGNRFTRYEAHTARDLESGQSTLGLFRRAYATAKSTTPLKFALYWDAVGRPFDASHYDPELNRDALVLARQAAQQASQGLLTIGDVAPADGILSLPEKMQRLGQLLLAEGCYLSATGDLDGAYDQHLAVLQMARHVAAGGGIVERRLALEMEETASLGLLHWAVRPGQTHSRIKSALVQLKLELAKFPMPMVTIRNEYALRQQLLSERLDLLLAGWEHDPFPFGPRYSFRVPWSLPGKVLVPWLHQLPSEQKRARDLLQHRAWADENRGSHLHDRPAGVKDENWWAFWRLSEPMTNFYWYHADYEEFAKSTPLIEQSIPQSFSEFVKLELDLETRRQALLTVLAVCGWRIEHGRLPESLQSLVGTYCDALPIDPASGKEFVYFSGESETGVRPEFLWVTSKQVQSNELHPKLVSLGMAARDWSDGNRSNANSVSVTTWGSKVQNFGLQKSFRIPSLGE